MLRLCVRASPPKLDDAYISLRAQRHSSGSSTLILRRVFKPRSSCAQRRHSPYPRAMRRARSALPLRRRPGSRGCRLRGRLGSTARRCELCGRGRRQAARGGVRRRGCPGHGLPARRAVRGRGPPSSLYPGVTREGQAPPRVRRPRPRARRCGLPRGRRRAGRARARRADGLDVGSGARGRASGRGP